MSTVQWVLFLGLAVVIVYGILVGGLVLAGRRSDARAVAGFVPDCIVLFKRMLGDPRLPRRYRAVVVAMLGYLALPVDVIPDFIPIAGQFDDAVVVVLALRAVLRGGGIGMLEEHWPGPRSSLSVLVRLATKS
jgi:uncharacterized membrane protein YkvA (DUF1232 family)